MYLHMLSVIIIIIITQNKITVRLDIVGTVYHLVIYMQSNKIHTVV